MSMIIIVYETNFNALTKAETQFYWLSQQWSCYKFQLVEQLRGWLLRKQNSQCCEKLKNLKVSPTATTQWSEKVGVSSSKQS